MPQTANVAHYRRLGAGDRHTARVKTYGDVLLEYEFHAETKNADSEESPSGKQSVGLLQRRHIEIGQIEYIGKESNKIEDVESGLTHSEVDIYTHYPDPRRDAWETKIRPALREIPVSKLVELSGISRTAIIYWRS